MDETQKNYKPLLIKGPENKRIEDKKILIATDELLISSTIFVKIRSRKPYIYSFELPESSIAIHIPRFLTSKPLDVIRFSYKLVCFACRVINANETKQVTGWSVKEMTRIKDKFYSTETFIQIKLAVIACIIKNYTAKDIIAISDEFEKRGLARTDRLFYQLLCHTGDINKIKNDLSKSVFSEKDLSYSALKRELTTDDLKSLMKCAGYYASNKLSFITSSNRFSHADMTSELFSNAFPAYFWVRPFYSKAHALNYTKASIRNWTQRLIQYYTDPKRARMIAEEDGYTNITKDLDDNVTNHFYGEDEETKIINLLDRKKSA